MTRKPKRPMSAYLCWLNHYREVVKTNKPGIRNKVTEIVKKGAELWRNMEDKRVWMKEAVIAKEQYKKDLEFYNAHQGGGEEKKATKRGKKAEKKPTPAVWMKEAVIAKEQYKKDLEFYNAHQGGGEEKKATKRGKKAEKKPTPEKSKKKKQQESEDEDDDDDEEESE